MSDDGEKRGRPDWALMLAGAFFVLTTLVMVVPIVFGIEILGVSDAGDVAALLKGFASSPIAPLAVIALFTLLGLTGFPQFLLIGGTVAIFGGVMGFIYSWIATMVSAHVGFLIGRASGASVLRRFGGRGLNRASEILGKRGILATFIIRNVPSGPFVMVNLIAGVTHIALWRFAAGTGLGIIPKTALIAFVGGRFMEFVKKQNPLEFAVAGLVLVLWFLLGLWVRRKFFGAGARPASDTASPGPATAESADSPASAASRQQQETFTTGADHGKQTHEDRAGGD